MLQDSFTFFFTVLAICQSLSENYAVRLLTHIAKQLETSNHLEFYLLWTKHLLFTWGRFLKDNSLDVMPTLISIQKNLSRSYESLGRMYVEVFFYSLIVYGDRALLLLVPYGLVQGSPFFKNLVSG